MKPVHHFNSISTYNAFNNHQTLHPLVSILDYSKAHPRYQSKMHFGLYCIVLKEVKCGDLKYGRHHYDYQEGTLVFISPGQVIEVENDGEPYQPLGHALAFHPDLIRGTSLVGSLAAHHFLGYNTNEALHLSDGCSLFFISHVAVKHTNAAQLRHDDRHFRFGDGVHR